MKRLIIRSIIFSTILSVSMSAQEFAEVKKITEEHVSIPDIYSGFYGNSVSIDENLLIVGAREGGEKFGVDSGMAVIYTFDNQSGSWSEIKRILPSDPGAQDEFGISVCISGDIAIVGAHKDDDNGRSSGSAYIFRRDKGGTNNWGEVRKLIPSDGKDGDGFGVSVSIQGDAAIIGATFDRIASTGNDAAYIFYQDEGGIENWGEVTKLTVEDNSRGDNFGRSVSISNNTVLIGAPREDNQGNDSGGVYIFSKDTGGKNNWGQVLKLIGSDVGSEDRFGSCVSIYGDFAIIGAESRFNTDGAAYIFEKNGGDENNWREIKKLRPEIGNSLTSYGTTVSIHENIATVGAFGINDISGAGYIYSKNLRGENNWGLVKKLTKSVVLRNDSFGGAISVNGDNVVIGAAQDGNGGFNNGAMYIFNKDSSGSNNWGQEVKLAGGNISPSIFLGKSVAVDNDIIVVGAEKNNEEFNLTGSVHVVKKDPDRIDTWNTEAELRSEDELAKDDFGHSLSVSGRTIIVGAPRDEEGGYSSGAAYMFSKINGREWSRVAKLKAVDLDAYDQFGQCVFVN